MRPDGHRYVRSYRVTGDALRWALWERQGGRNRRVGTATTAEGYLRFLGFEGDEFARHVASEQSARISGPSALPSPPAAPDEVNAATAST